LVGASFFFWTFLTGLGWAERRHPSVRVQTEEAPKLGASQAVMSLREAAMAVLWFVRADAMYGFPAYQFPVSDIVRKLGGGHASSFFAV
jgi:hypothetical protein